MWDGSGSKTQMRTIVGVAGDVKTYSLVQPSEPTVYWPITQIPSDSTMYVAVRTIRSEEHTSELQSRLHLVCRLLLEKKKKKLTNKIHEANNQNNRGLSQYLNRRVNSN